MCDALSAPPAYVSLWNQRSFANSKLERLDVRHQAK
jgi:hypothetical protein